MRINIVIIGGWDLHLMFYVGSGMAFNVGFILKIVQFLS